MKYIIDLKTISPLILSNRMNDALYKGIDFRSFREESLSKVNIVYQFACYEDRALQMMEKEFYKAKEYYMPASSIKGALCLDKEYRNLKFKDIKINMDSINLTKLYKFQYLYQDECNKDEQPKEIRFSEYFPNILIEALYSGQKLSGEIVTKGNDRINFENIVEYIDIKTREKLSRYLNQIEKISSKVYCDPQKSCNNTDISKMYNTYGLDKFKELKERIKEVLANREAKIAFMGGFKGLINSLNNYGFIEDNELRSGFYADKDVMLPYGLVEIGISEQ